MSTEDPIAPMIPWYANGTLDAQERPRLEEHLASCADCQGLLAQALELKEALRSVPPGRLEDHLQAQLLAEIAEDPDRLEPDDAGWARSHLAACTACADAVEACRESLAVTAPAASPAEPARLALPPVLTRLWRYLTATWLRPLPALAYLLVAVALAVPVLRSPEVAERAPAALLHGIIVSGSGTFRDGPEPAPAIEVPAGTGPVLFELRTGIDAADLRDPAAAFRFEVRGSEGAIWSEERRGGTLGEAGTFPLLLHPAALSGESPYRIVIVYEKAGDPMDGRVVFQRTFHIVRSTTKPAG